jgi:hypothetical protein
MDHVFEIVRVRELMGLIVEQETPNEVIYYQKCEGGDGLIDPKSFEVSELKTKEGKMIIKFVSEPDINYDGGRSASIRTCLGGDIPFMNSDSEGKPKGRCFRVGVYGDKKIASMEVDCDTGEDL